VDGEPSLRAVIEKRLIRSFTIASVTAGLLIVLVFELNNTQPAGRSRLVDIATAFGSFTVLAVLFYVVDRARALRMSRPLIAWIDENRDPNPIERRQTLRLPWRFSVFLFRLWVVAAVLNAAAPIITSREYRHAIAALIGILLGGLATSGLAYFLAEREMRPVLALALAGQVPDRPATVPLRSRFILAWALGSGIPLALLVVTPVIRDRGVDVPLSVSVVVLALIVLPCCFALVVAATRSVVEPLERVRRALDAIAAGDLTTHIDVDDGGELGMVQGGLNRMVTGLRERERLRDLFGRHVGPDVARNAIERGVQLGGEQREVSVFFVDLIGSTARAEAEDPGAVVDLLNRFFAIVVRVATDAGGWVDKFEGDGALCVFGAPAALADHASSALRAARTLGAELHRNGIEAGVGVATGSVVAGNVGTEERLEYTVIGRAVNTAARLTDAAKSRPARILAAAGSIDAAPAISGEAHHWQAAGTVDLRGIGTVSVFEPRPREAHGM